MTKKIKIVCVITLSFTAAFSALAGWPCKVPQVTSTCDAGANLNACESQYSNTMCGVDSKVCTYSKWKELKNLGRKDEVCVTSGNEDDCCQLGVDDCDEVKEGDCENYIKLTCEAAVQPGGVGGSVYENVWDCRKLPPVTNTAPAGYRTTATDC